MLPLPVRLPLAMLPLVVRLVLSWPAFNMRADQPKNSPPTISQRKGECTDLCVDGLTNLSNTCQVAIGMPCAGKWGPWTECANYSDPEGRLGCHTNLLTSNEWQRRLDDTESSHLAGVSGSGPLSPSASSKNSSACRSTLNSDCHVW